MVLVLTVRDRKRRAFSPSGEPARQSGVVLHRFRRAESWTQFSGWYARDCRIDYIPGKRNVIHDIYGQLRYCTWLKRNEKERCICTVIVMQAVVYRGGPRFNHHICQNQNDSGP